MRSFGGRVSSGPSRTIGFLKHLVYLDAFAPEREARRSSRRQATTFELVISIKLPPYPAAVAAPLESGREFIPVCCAAGARP
jgi:hypothetical protein